MTIAASGATHTVDSSVLAGIDYDGQTSMLQLQFCDGAIYQYFDVPAAIYHEILAASSAGTFFNSYIRGRFRHRRPRDPR